MTENIIVIEAGINPNLNQSIMQEEGSVFGHNSSTTSPTVAPVLKTPESDYFHMLRIRDGEKAVVKSKANN